MPRVAHTSSYVSPNYNLEGWFHFTDEETKTKRLTSQVSMSLLFLHCIVITCHAVIHYGGNSLGLYTFPIWNLST